MSYIYIRLTHPKDKLRVMYDKSSDAFDAVVHTDAYYYDPEYVAKTVVKYNGRKANLVFSHVEELDGATLLIFDHVPLPTTWQHIKKFVVDALWV